MQVLEVSACEARFHLELKRVSSEVNEAGRWLVAAGSTCSVG